MRGSIILCNCCECNNSVSFVDRYCFLRAKSLQLGVLPSEAYVPCNKLCKSSVVASSIVVVCLLPDNSTGFAITHANIPLITSTLFFWCLLAGGGVYATTSGSGSSVGFFECTMNSNHAYSGGDPLVTPVCDVSVVHIIGLPPCHWSVARIVQTVLEPWHC